MPKSLSQEKQLKWKILIEKQRQSSLPIRKWCLQNEVNPHTFQYWKAKLSSRKLQKSSFTELKSLSTQPISLRACGLYIRLESSCDPHLRKQLLAIVGELSC